MSRYVMSRVLLYVVSLESLALSRISMSRMMYTGMLGAKSVTTYDVSELMSRQRVKGAGCVKL